MPLGGGRAIEKSYSRISGYAGTTAKFADDHPYHENTNEHRPADIRVFVLLFHSWTVLV